MISFAWPWLLLLLPLPYVVYRFAGSGQQPQAALKVPFYASLAGQSQDAGQTMPSHNRPLWLVATLWLLLVLAASRPQWMGDAVELPASGRDLMMAVDLSKSMDATDMELNSKLAMRIDMVKHVVAQFVERREGDRLGLILFGESAYLQSPLTFDRDTVNQLLQEAPLGLPGGRGTAIGDAIGLGVKRLRERPESSRVLILLTDGANNMGAITPNQAAELAQQAQVRIYTIGIGADVAYRKDLMSRLLGGGRYNPSEGLDEDTLTAIAEVSGGRYFRARSQQELEEIYQLLDQLEPIDLANESYRPVTSLYIWPLALVMLISLMWAAKGLLPSGSKQRNASTEPFGSKSTPSLQAQPSMVHPIAENKGDISDA